MAAIQFPNNPNAGDLFTASNGIRYTYDGEKWKTLGTSTVGTEGQFLETPTELTIDKVIPGNTNTGAVGSLAIGAGVTLTVPATSSFRTLLGKSGTYGIPETGGTFTGPVSFDDNTIIKGNSTDGSGELTLNCENNSHGIKIKGPPHSAGATYTLILPNDTGTSGQVLTTNGSGVSSWSSVLPATGGTLTGGLTGTTANFSGNVGIGTTSPQSLLSVKVSASRQLDAIKDSGDDHLVLKSSAPDASYNLRSIELAGNDVSFSTGASSGTSYTERLRIDSSGNVGIGTSSPQSKLSVGNGASTDSGLSITFTGDNSTLAKFFANTATGEITIGGAANNYFPTFYASGSERMRIDTSGRVGIGLSTNIGAALHVDPAANVTTGYGAPLIKVGGANSWGGPGSLYSIGFGYNNGSTDISPAEIGIVTTNASNETNGALVFATRNVVTNTAPTERVRIESSGNVQFVTGDAVFPTNDNSIELGGGATYRWSQVWAANGTIQTSDIRTKTEVISSSLGSDFIKTLRPVSYKWVEGGRRPTETIGEDGLPLYESVPGVRTHWGFIAQEVKQAVDDAGVDFGGWVLTDKDDDDSHQALRYDQFIAPLTKALQEAIEEIETLKQRLSDAGIA